MNKNSSGAYRTRAFYVDRYGNKIEELLQEDIRFGATGSVQEQGGPEQNTFINYLDLTKWKIEDVPR